MFYSQRCCHIALFIMDYTWTLKTSLVCDKLNQETKMPHLEFKRTPSKKQKIILNFCSSKIFFILISQYTTPFKKFSAKWKKIFLPLTLQLFLKLSPQDLEWDLVCSVHSSYCSASSWHHWYIFQFFQFQQDPNDHIFHPIKKNFNVIDFSVITNLLIISA